MKQIKLAFGEKQMTVNLPENQVVDIVEGNLVPGVTDIREAVQAALRKPIGAPPLCEIVGPSDKVVIIVSDITRQWVRHDLFLPALCNELNAAGVPDSHIKLVVALGAHRRHTDEENIKNYGEDVVKRVAIVQSYALDKQDFVKIGTTSRGVDVTINHHVLEADKVILTGGICYHSMAGYGGGRKAILPGVSGYDSIQGNHRFCLSEVEGGGLNPHCTAGSLEENEMHQDMMEMARMVNPDFLLNAVFNPEGEIAGFYAGHWYEAWLEGCKKVKEIYGVPIKETADLVIVSSGGFPKDINLYQASKAVENACGAVKKGGVMIALMECRDIAEPPDFSQWFDYVSLTQREIALRKAFTVPGFVALKMGYIAREIPVIVVTLPENAAFFDKAGMTAVATVEEALDAAKGRLPSQDYRIMVIPHGGTTLPLVTG